MPKQTPSQQRKIKKVMHEYKHDELKSGGSGKKVKNKKQAIAIALSEAGASRKDKKSSTKKTGTKKAGTKKSSAAKKSTGKKTDSRKSTTNRKK